ncbi:MAG TPA: BON domain-containing protein [Blastocatellia bacterium]|nr:BON domain-containing protein [Blastocatellia bacterium]
MVRRILVFLLALVVLGVVIGVVFRSRWRMPQAAHEVAQKATDSATTGKVKVALALSKRLSAYDISVDTHDGIVTLTGRVPSEIDRELAANVTKDTVGVSQVNNQLEVDPGVTPSDAGARESARVADLEIRADLQERLSSSEQLKGQNIQISVENRVVTLSGQVETPQQKTGAEQLARSVSNVSSVVNNLTVARPSAPQSEVPGVSENATKDRELSRQVLFALFSEREYFSDVGAIRAEGQNGMVTLAGTVASRAEKALAERIARDVSGVRSVNNQLTVATQPTPAPGRRSGK